MSDHSLGNDKHTTAVDGLAVPDMHRCYIESKVNWPLRTKPITISKTLQCEKRFIYQETDKIYTSVSQQAYIMAM